MNLIPFSRQYLRLNESLPFGIRDASGRLLLAAGSKVDRTDMLAELQANDLYADEFESSEWRKRLASAMDSAIRQNASLRKIADARPEGEVEKPKGRELGIGESWGELALVLESSLRDLRSETTWMARLVAVRDQAQRLADRRPDASLYHLIHTAGASTEHYSANHSLLCMVVAREAAVTLGLGDELIASLVHAALTMNVAMRRLQDLLAAGNPHITAEMRQEIDTHAERSAQMLENAGVADAAWVEVVRHHHDDSQAATPWAQLNPTQRASRLLRRVDVFTAKLSRRSNRTPMSPVLAARQACLGADGRPDEIGAALLKTVGMYPPGSYVELASGEVGIVIARGRQANLPVVASLVSASGSALHVPAVRETVDKRHAVKCAVPMERVKVRAPHEKLMQLR